MRVAFSTHQPRQLIQRHILKSVTAFLHTPDYSSILTLEIQVLQIKELALIHMIDYGLNIPSS